MKIDARKLSLKLSDEAASLELGKRMSHLCGTDCIIYLQGELGAGKTTFVRGFLRGLGYEGKVKSPTFTLVESYEFEPNYKIFHFDLYRLVNPEELDFIGIRDYFDLDAICLIEWPERALNSLKSPDIWMKWQVLDEGRKVELEGFTAKGQKVVNQLEVE